MAAYEVLLLNTAIPQIQAAQSGDTYVVPRDIAINATAIISANSATDALRITQTGAGNAILVEDSANPDSTPFVVTAAGDVGIGTTNPLYKLHVNGNIYASAIQIGEASAFLSNSPDALIGWASSFSGYTNGTLILQSRSSAATPIVFATGTTSATERARITSGGSLFVGSQNAVWNASEKISSTSGIADAPAYTGFVTGDANTAVYISWNNAASGTRVHMRFADGAAGSLRGSITSDGANTAFNTTSDYRLKDNAQPLTGSGAFIDALQPKTWIWKENGKTGVGFIAHEVQAVSPGTVVGEKDAVDADGKPIMQAMEYGSAEFIANIIAELQSLRARVKALEGA